jgi:hypothetical protein
MTSDLDQALADNPAQPESARTVTTPKARCRGRHTWVLRAAALGEPMPTYCRSCGAVRDEAKAKRGKQSRNYGNRAELDVARRYGGTKVGHAGGPVDVRGTDWNTQVKTHRRKPPAEWSTVFAKLEASTDRLPRLLLRFVHPGGPTDYVVVPGKAWLDWFGKDEEAA